MYVHTVEQDISADTLFSRLGDFGILRILIFADAGTDHSSFTVTYFLFLLKLFVIREDIKVSLSFF